MVGLMLLALLTGGCAAKQQMALSLQQKATSVTESVRVVLVDINGNALNGEQADAASRYRVGERLQQAITGVLSARSRYDAENGVVSLHIMVNSLRLRSAASALMFGVMAGPDRLAVDVIVKQEGRIVKTYHTDTSTALGGLLLPAPTQRIERMVKTLSERIVLGL